MQQANFIPINWIKKAIYNNYDQYEQQKIKKRADLYFQKIEFIYYYSLDK